MDDLIALTRDNDPFNVGANGQIDQAKWFTALYHRLGYHLLWARGERINLRRMHYHLVSLSPPALLPNGGVYENDAKDRCWDTLLNGSKYARYLGLVPAASFDDMKGELHQMTVAAPSEPDLLVEGVLWSEDLDIPDFPDLPDYGVESYHARQRYHLEIWIEKTSMNSRLLPLCKRYGVNLQTGAGELSITSAHDLALRLRDGARPVRILYISDHDPGGRSMPLAIARKLEFFIYRAGIDADVRLLHIMLTPEQIEEYDLPRIEIKDGDVRKVAFEDRFGEGGVELDALEALHPGALTDVVEAWIKRYHDDTLDDRIQEALGELEADLRNIRETVYEKHAESVAPLKERYDALATEFQERMAPVREEIGKLWQTVETDLYDSMPDLADYPIPEAEEAEEPDDDGILYDSMRDYWDQIAAYKEFQGKEAPPEAPDLSAGAGSDASGMERREPGKKRRNSKAFVLQTLADHPEWRHIDVAAFCDVGKNYVSKVIKEVRDAKIKEAQAR